MRFLQRLFDAGQRLDRTASARTRFGRLAAKVGPQIPPGLLRTMEARYVPLWILSIVIALLASTLLTPTPGRITTGGEDSSAAAAPAEPGQAIEGPAPETTGPGQEVARAAGKARAAVPRTRYEGTLGTRRPSWYKSGVPFDPSKWPVNPWPGVTANKIRILFHMTKQSCGDNYSALVDQVLRFQSRWEKTILPLVSYFNTRAAQLYGGDPSDPEQPNALTYFPKSTLFGRTIEPVFEFDDGGPYCEEKARTQVGDRAYQGGYPGGPVFAAVGAGYGAERFIAENMIGPCINDRSKKCPIHVGSYWYTDGWYNEKKPYAWSHWASSSRIVQGLASWMGQYNRQTGGKADFSPQQAGKQRRFGIITVDTPDNHRMIGEFIGQLTRNGIRQPDGSTVADPRDVIYTPIPLSGRQQVMTQACASFSTNGYTTIFHLGSVLDPIFMFPACTSQTYFPEWPISSIGYFDVGTAGRAYRDLDGGAQTQVYGKQIDHAKGESTLQSKESVSTPPEQSQHGLAWTVVCPPDPKAPHDPNCPKDSNGNWETTIPDDLALWYYPIAIMHGLFAASGPALSPPNIQKYIQEVCNPCNRNAYITITFGYNENDHTSIDDHVGWKWNGKKPDPSADRSDYQDTDGDGKGDQPPLGSYEVDTSMREGRRCFDFTDASSCHT